MLTRPNENTAVSGGDDGPVKITGLQDNNRNDSPSKASQYSEILVQAIAWSFSKILAILLHSPEAVAEYPMAQRNDVVERIVRREFRNAGKKMKLQESETQQLNYVRDRVLELWKSLP